MARLLYLMRHAQSADKQPAFSDIERELTPRGIREALDIGGHLVAHKYFPELILSSTANRSKATAQLIVDTMKLPPEALQLDDELYTASPRTFIDLIVQLDDSLNTVMCVGHNPTISYIAEYLTSAEIGNLPTAGLVIIQFNIPRWREIDQHKGELVRLLNPELL